MTNIKARGFGSPALLQEYLDEIEEPQARTSSFGNRRTSENVDVASLREQVADLREKILAFKNRENPTGARPRAHSHPLLRIAGTVAITIMLGRMVQGFGSGLRLISRRLS